MGTDLSYKQTIESEWVTFMIDDNYKWVLFVTMVMCVHYFTCVMQGGAPRGKLFTQDWMEEKFGKEHEAALNGQKITKGGYPDCGSGRYTMELGYEGWMNFNKAQRIHLNYMESISQVLAMMLICGLYYTRTTAIWGGIYVLARILFQVGYALFGPKGRMPAVPVIMLTQFFLPVFTIVSLY